MRILQYSDYGVSENVRLTLPRRFLLRRGYDVSGFRIVDWRREDGIEVPPADVHIFSRLPLVRTFESIRDRGEAIIYDLDDNFFEIEKTHPSYEALGPGNPFFLDRIIKCLKLSTLVTVTCESLKQVCLEKSGIPEEKVRIIPNGWGMTYYRHSRSTNPQMCTFGWAGTPTHKRDFELVVKPLKKILLEYPWTRIALAGDQKLYNFFDRIPDRQKLILPNVLFDYYFYLLGFFDVVLAPLENIPFNRSKSPLRLIDAGAKSLPWIASPVGEYVSFGEGNPSLLYANSDDEWFDRLQAMAVSSEERKTVGRHCKHLSQKYHMAYLINDWEVTLHESTLSSR